MVAAGHGWKNVVAADGAGSRGTIPFHLSSLGGRAAPSRGTCETIFTLAGSKLCTQGQLPIFLRKVPPPMRVDARQNGWHCWNALRFAPSPTVSPVSFEIPSIGVSSSKAPKITD